MVYDLHGQLSPALVPEIIPIQKITLKNKNDFDVICVGWASLRRNPTKLKQLYSDQSVEKQTLGYGLSDRTQPTYPVWLVVW